MTFQEVFDKWDWKPIRTCPGRHIFAKGVSHLTLSEIVENDSTVFEHTTKVVPDTVLIVKLTDGGGLISYRKSETSFLHTLNDKEGFARKLNQLQIKL